MNLVLSTLPELCGFSAFVEEYFNLKQEQQQICLQNIEWKIQRDLTRKLIMNQLVNSP